MGECEDEETGRRGELSVQKTQMRAGKQGEGRADERRSRGVETGRGAGQGMRQR